MGTYDVKVHHEQGGDVMRVESGGSIKVDTGGAVLLAGQAVDAEFSIAAAGTNVTEVTIQFVDGFGNAVAAPTAFFLILSDTQNADALTATTASGTVGLKSGASGVAAALTTKKHLACVSSSAGVFILSITDSAKTGFYIGIFTGGSGAIVSRQLVTEDYG